MSEMSRVCMSLLPLTLAALAMMVGSTYGDMKPTKFAKEVVCEGCHAVIAEANQILGKGRRTDRTIRNALNAVCDTQRLNRYEFSPPTMNKVCKYWTENYEDEIIKALTNGLPEEEQEIELCFTTTDICVGVDRSKFRINKYEGPSKRKILAARKAAKGEAEDEGEVTEEKVVEKSSEDGMKTKKESVTKEEKDRSSDDRKTSKKEGVRKEKGRSTEDRKTAKEETVRKDSKKGGKGKIKEVDETEKAKQANGDKKKENRESKSKSKSEEQKDEL